MEREGPALEFTGERCLPWIGDIQVVYEHIHRYRFAAALADGCRVLDLGSGEGYGAAILAETAETVVGIDIDGPSIEHSRARYPAPNLTFQQGSVVELGGFEDDAFDLVVCFEVIEHVSEHEQVVAEVRRVLRPEGIFVLSTPNRDAYNAGLRQPNPFHVREIDETELTLLLRPEFPNLAVWGQRLAIGSEFVLREPPTAEIVSEWQRNDSLRIAVEKTAGQEWAESPSVPDVYLVCIASAGELPALPRVSTLVDVGWTLLRQNEQLIAESRAEVAELDQQLAQSRRKLERAAARADQLARTMGALRDEAAVLGEAAAETEILRRRAQEAEKLVGLIKGSQGWRLLERARRVIAPARRVLRRTMKPTKLAPATPPQIEPEVLGDLEPISLLTAEVPVVSIVIPVHNNAAYTLRCLSSLATHAAITPLEVIVVDDASAAETFEALAAVEGIRLLRNGANQGFLHSSYRGASEAKGRYVLFLNNDVEVMPGWLDALVEAMESAPDIGAVGSKLLYPNGRLQEAGSFVWSDGSAWNYGRGDDPDRPMYNFRRDVDYCSAACLLVRRELFEELGFDPRFAPAYYEDVDLCFALRDAGYRVVYEPRSVVVHHEGMSHGREDRNGGPPLESDLRDVPLLGKSHQYRNQSFFAEKWARALAEHRPPGDHSGLLGGRFQERPRVLVADAWVPAHDRDAGSLRMTWILKLLRTLGSEVTLFPLNRFAREPYTSELQELGVEVYYGQESFSQFAETRAGLYDVVILSRPPVAEALLDDVHRFFPNSSVVYDTVDLHFLRDERRRALEGFADSDEGEKAKQAELDHMKRSDVVIVVTDAEAEIVSSLLPDQEVSVIPTIHELSSGAGLPFAAREDLLFIGGFNHPPNTDAVLYFVSQVFPLVTGRLATRLWVVGSDPPEEILALQSPDVVVTGYVPDVDAYFQRTRVFVSPLRYGAGMKGKNGHALAMGLPLVTTSIGAEGMNLEAGKHALIHDDPTEFANAVIAAYSDPMLWQRLAECGKALVRERWSPDVMRGRIEELLRTIRGPEFVPVSSARSRARS